jgi:diacylglycerol kinase family enzyme
MGKPQALTLVLNPHARKPKLSAPSLGHLHDLLGPTARIHVTQDLDELDALMGAWNEEDETVCFYGGDGSIARGLTSLIRHQGEDFTLPPVLVVRAGTINMLATIVGFREGVERTLKRWRAGELRCLRSIPTIRVEMGNQPPQYGFVLAWGVGYRVLKEYYARRPVPDVSDGMAVMAKAFLQACHPRADEQPFFRAEEIGLRVDGAEIPGPQRSLVAGTISRLSLGIRPFPPGEALAGAFSYTSHALSLAKVVLHAPTLLFGAGDARKLRRERELACNSGIRELDCRLTEGFTMDGEMFELQEPTPVRIRPGPVVRFWTHVDA